MSAETRSKSLNRPMLKRPRMMVNRKKKENTRTRWNAIDLGCLIAIDHGFVRRPTDVDRRRV